MGFEGSIGMVRTMLEGLDLDGDGLIEYDDFLAAALSKQQILKERKMYAAFKHFDSDNSGFITVENLRSVLPGKDVEDYIAEVDMDGDRYYLVFQFDAYFYCLLLIEAIHLML